jgi:hypothetical protein
MTKKEEETPKNKLTWRLSDLPTASEVASLVDSNVLSIDEARQILIKEEVPKSNSEEIEALKDMVAKLQETVKDLLSRPPTINIPFTKVIEVPRRYRPYWETTFLNSGGVYGSTGIKTDMATAVNGNGMLTLTSNVIN